MFTELGLTTAWHLTDVDNLPSIAAFGLRSRNALSVGRIPFNEVGWDHIVNSRPSGHDAVLTFMTPRNKFVHGRHMRHAQQHPRSRGLCLLEIDIRVASRGEPDRVTVTSGNVAKKTIPVAMATLPHFEEVINWNAHLNWACAETDVIANARMAEIHFPDPVPATAIRHVMVATQSVAEIARKHWNLSEVLTVDGLLAEGFSLPTACRQNFSVRNAYEPFQIFSSRYGNGTVIAGLGNGRRAIARFDDQLQVISFGSYYRVR